MALSTTRDDIATALSTVTGVTGYVTRPKAPKAGDAWPLLSGLDRGPGETWAADWRVLLLLGADEQTSIDRTDELFHDVADALGAVLYVDRVEPVTVNTSGGDLFALQITGRSE